MFELSVGDRSFTASEPCYDFTRIGLDEIRNLEGKP